MGETNLTFVGKQGYYQDTEVDLYMLGMGNASGGGRPYDPAVGRFLAEDPRGFDAGDENLYRYVGNNPVNVIDPSGQQSCISRGSQSPVYECKAPDPIPELAPQPAVGPDPLQQPATSCSTETRPACDWRGELQKVQDAMQSAGQGAANFKAAWDQNQPKEKLFQHILNEMPPWNWKRTFDNARACCQCVGQAVGNPSLRGLRDDCVGELGDFFKSAGQFGFQSALGAIVPFGSFLFRPKLPQGSFESCWKYVAKLLPAPPENAKASTIVEWLLDQFNNPCLKILQPARVLIETADGYRGRFVLIVKMLECLFENREVYQQNLVNWASQRISGVKACIDEAWSKVEQVALGAVKQIVGAVAGGGPVQQVLQGIGKATVCMFLDTIKQSITEVFTNPIDWIESMKAGIAEAINPIDSLRGNFTNMVDGAKQALKGFLTADFSGGAEGLTKTLGSAMGMVDSLGGYIYLVTVGLPTLIGSVIPAAGNAAGASIGQTINTVIATVRQGVGAVLEGIQRVQDVFNLRALIQEKIAQAEEFAEEADETLADLANVNDASEIPALLFSDEEVETVAQFVGGFISTVFFTGVGLLMSLIGTGLRTAYTKFKERFGRKISGKGGKAKATAKKRCATCNKKKSGSTSSSKCFPAGTLVHTAEGLRPIEEVRAGTLVWGWDSRLGEWQLAHVTEAYQTDYEGDVVTVVLSGETITSTGGHPFWVSSGEALSERPRVAELAGEPGGTDEPRKSTPVADGRWVSARDLCSGDLIVARAAGHRAVLCITRGSRSLTTYNLLVEQVHCYAVGSIGALVHNNSPKCDVPDPCGVQATLLRRWHKMVKALENCEERQKATLLNKCCDAVKRACSTEKARPMTSAEKEACPKNPTCCGTEKITSGNIFLVIGNKIKKGASELTQYAQSAQEYRNAKGHRERSFLRGSHNLGAVVIRYAEGGDERRLPLQSNSFYVGIGGSHAEEQMLDKLRELVGGKKKKCFTIIELFSERSPCTGCASQLNNAPGSAGLENYFQEKKFRFIWIVQWYANDTTEQTGKRLREGYKNLGLPLDPD